MLESGQNFVLEGNFTTGVPGAPRKIKLNSKQNMRVKHFIKTTNTTESRSEFGNIMSQMVLLSDTKN